MIIEGKKREERGLPFLGFRKRGNDAGRKKERETVGSPVYHLGHEGRGGLKTHVSSGLKREGWVKEERY